MHISMAVEVTFHGEKEGGGGGVLKKKRKHWLHMMRAGLAWW